MGILNIQSYNFFTKPSACNADFLSHITRFRPQKRLFVDYLAGNLKKTLHKSTKNNMQTRAKKPQANTSEAKSFAQKNKIRLHK